MAGGLRSIRNSALSIEGHGVSDTENEIHSSSPATQLHKNIPVSEAKSLRHSNKTTKIKQKIKKKLNKNGVSFHNTTQITPTVGK